jgi:PAS domain S-box-containing protein
MKPNHYGSSLLGWVVIILVLAAALSAGLYARVTLRAVERTLPTILLDQLQALNGISEGLSAVTSASVLAQKDPSPASINDLIHQIDELFGELIELRNTYVFDNLVQASALHDAVAPSLVDARQWLTHGVSGHSPYSPLTLAVTYSRLHSALVKAWNVRRESHATAQIILEQQRQRLDKFLIGVNVLMALSVIVFALVLVLMFRQRRLLRREADARAERKRLIAIIESTSDLVSMATVNEDLIYLNRSGRKMVGWKADESLAAKKIAMLHPPWAMEVIRNLGCPTAVRDGVWSGETALQHLDGYEIPVSQTIMVHRDVDGNIENLSTIMRDIRERKQTEKSLRDREERAIRQRTAIADLAVDPVVHADDMIVAFQKLVGVAGVTIRVSRAGIWRFSGDGRFLECQALYGAFSAQNGPGTQINIADFPSYFEAIRAENRVSSEDVQSDLRTRELAEKYLQPLDITSLLAAGIIIKGELAGVLCLEHAGGARKWHADEEAFAGTVAGMAAQVIINAEHLRLADQLRQAQKMESVGRLAGGVAHDFNNMLTVIQGYAQFGLEETDSADPLYYKLQQILNAATRSAAITSQLLAFARKQTISPKVLDLNHTLEGMLNILKRLIGEDIELTWRPATNLWPVKMDSSQIDQILTNLCVNARDAISGVGRIIIETDMVRLDRAYCDKHTGCVPGDYVLLVVSDNGCGMEKELLENLFEPFFTTKGVGEGTGLGLATVYGIVSQNNGFIDVSSGPERGTTFTIYLPRYFPSATDVINIPARATALRGSETILLVEDEPMILAMTREMLERLGYKVLAADRPEESIRMAGEYDGEINLLMTDVVMPEMNGMDLAERVAALYPDIKLLFMSGYTADVVAHRGVLDEGVAFLQKPFILKDLADKLRRVLQS